MGGSGCSGWGVRVDVGYFFLYFFFFFLGGGGGVGFGGRCEQRSEVFVKIQNIFFFFFGGGEVRSGGVRGGGGGQGGCERRIEVFVKIQKNWGGGVRSGVGLGVRLDVNEEW